LTEALRGMALTDEQRETLKRFTPNDDASEATLRECVAELRVLRKSIRKN